MEMNLFFGSTDLDVASIIILWGVSALVGALLGAITAAMKDRSADTWGFACFIFPPLWILLLLLPKGNYSERRRKISTRDLDEDIKDEWF